MKPCSNRRKAIALLALNELGVREAQMLRTHLQFCEGCRRYFEEISIVTEKMAAVEMPCDVEASEAFHRGVMARLRTEESAGRKITDLLGNLLSWRVALPMTAVCVLIIGLRAQRQISNVPSQPTAPMPLQIVSARDADAEIPPTLANYQMAADQSLQKFDAFLNQESKKAIPTERIYTASTFTLADSEQ